MDKIIKLKEKYEKRLNQLEDDIRYYEASNNNEFKIAARTFKGEAEELRIIVDALEYKIISVGEKNGSKA